MCKTNTGNEDRETGEDFSSFKMLISWYRYSEWHFWMQGVLTLQVQTFKYFNWDSTPSLLALQHSAPSISSNAVHKIAWVSSNWIGTAVFIVGSVIFASTLFAFPRYLRFHVVCFSTLFPSPTAIDVTGVAVFRYSRKQVCPFPKVIWVVTTTTTDTVRQNTLYLCSLGRCQLFPPRRLGRCSSRP